MKNCLLLLLSLLGSEVYAQVVADDLLADWGYEINPNSTYLREFCVGSISTVTADYQGIRIVENKSVMDEPRLRFTLGKLVYQSIEEAEQSVTEINEPTQRSSKHAKMCDIRRAFSAGHVVYFVHTDVGLFMPEISGIMEKIHRHVQ